MTFNEQERSFLERRRRFTRSWPLVGTLLLAAVLTLTAWLFWSNPLLVNPWAVLTGLKAQSLPESTLSLMAFLLPIATLLCLSTLCILVLLTFVAFSNERRHIAVIDRLIRTQDTARQRLEDTE